jgi:hypothetical protein
MNKRRLVEILTRLYELLSVHQVSYATIIHPLIVKLNELPEDQLPASVRQEIYDLYGGMGSLTDVYISKLNNHLVDDEKEANSLLEALRKSLWDEINSSM